MPNIKAPKRPEVTQSGESTNIMFDPNSFSDESKKNGTSAWGLYQIFIGGWQAKLFKEKLPNEKEYRHSLAEENEALSLVAKNVQDDIERGTLKAEGLDSGIVILLALHKANLLEPYILINMADKGIAQDYAAYREKNRDKIRQYLDEFIVPKTPNK
jgi:hypothetical protein